MNPSVETPSKYLQENGAISETRPQSTCKYFHWFFIIAALTLALDQISKWWIRATLPLGGEAELWPGWIHWSHVLNYGAAWGMLSGQRWFLVTVAFGVSAAVIFAARAQASRRLPMWSLGFIFGGALGNLVDRILAGAVTDFLDLDTPWRFLQTFPVFNLADSALTVGIILLACDALFPKQEIEPQINTDEHGYQK